MTVLYEDRFITCEPDALAVRWYFFPAGTKRIPYDDIRSVERVRVTARAWKGRIWGTGNPRFWAHLDPGRPHKPWALVLDVGARVRPVVTPDDADAVLSVLRQRAHGAEIVQAPSA